MTTNRFSILVALEGSDEGLKRGAGIPITVLASKLVLRRWLDAARLMAEIENSVRQIS